MKRRELLTGLVAAVFGARVAKAGPRRDIAAIQRAIIREGDDLVCRISRVDGPDGEIVGGRDMRTRPALNLTQGEHDEIAQTVGNLLPGAVFCVWPRHDGLGWGGNVVIWRNGHRYQCPDSGTFSISNPVDTMEEATMAAARLNDVLNGAT